MHVLCDTVFFFVRKTKVHTWSHLKMVMTLKQLWLQSTFASRLFQSGGINTEPPFEFALFNLQPWLTRKSRHPLNYYHAATLALFTMAKV